MPQAKSIENLNNLLNVFEHVSLLLHQPGDVVEFRHTIVWTKFDLAELAEGDVEEVEHPDVLGN